MNIKNTKKFKELVLKVLNKMGNNTRNSPSYNTKNIAIKTNCTDIFKRTLDNDLKPHS